MIDRPHDIVYEIALKLERADKHIFDLKELWNSSNAQFSRDNPDFIVRKEDPDTGDRSYYIGIPLYPPDEVSLIAGDAIHNLRTALDHLAHHLVDIGTKSQGPFTGVFFPIGDSPEDYKTKLGRIVDRLRLDAVDEIHAVEPYRGGKGHDLWRLHRLDIIDKHRVRLEASYSAGYHSMTPNERARLAKNLGMDHVPSGKVLLTANAGIVFPLKVGSKLCTVPKAEVEEEMRFAFDIAFNEPGVIEGDSVLVSLNNMRYLIHQITMTLDRKGILV